MNYQFNKTRFENAFVQSSMKEQEKIDERLDIAADQICTFVSSAEASDQEIVQVNAELSSISLELRLMANHILRAKLSEDSRTILLDNVASLLADIMAVWDTLLGLLDDTLGHSDDALYQRTSKAHEKELLGSFGAHPCSCCNCPMEEGFLFPTLP